MGKFGEIIAVNAYVLTAGPEAFAAAIGALAGRVEREGDPGVLSYRFYGDGAEGGRAVNRFAGPGAWMRHHETAFTWPEMTAFRQVARLVHVTLLGPYTDEMRAWMARGPVPVPVTHVPDFVAGFER